MLNWKKLAALTSVVALIPMLAASADATVLAQRLLAYPAGKVNVQYYRHYRRYARRNRRPVYGRGYMNCINSGHDADFCKSLSRDFRD
jgi:hypothetical protein